jgi:serine/threonine protein kinase
VSPRFEYGFIDGVENLNNYTKGGYHPMQIADVLCNRYEVVDKLGYGGWSTVWLAHDRQEKGMSLSKLALQTPCFRK